MSSSRRHFLQAAGAAGLALPGMAPDPAAAGQTPKISANDRIRIATIGLGGMGSEDTHSALQVPGVELVSVSDIYQGRLDHAKELHGNQLFTTRDYREVLARKDIDAVIIATPDHWHTHIAIDAMEAGKDVYLEKPMIHDVTQGHPVIQAGKKTTRILQVGSQRVSSIVYKKAKELYEGGAIGTLNMVEAFWDRNSALGAWQYSIPPDATPGNIDWDRFLGSAPKVPFEPVRLFRWRNYRDYGTGVAGDLFVHLFSGIHFVLNSIGPTRIYSTGGLRFWNDGRDVPDVMLGLFDYPKTASHPAFTLALRVNFVSGAGEDSAFRFVGSEGIMQIGQGVSISKVPRETEPGYTIETFAERTQKEFLKQYREKYPEEKASADAMRPQEQERFVPPHGYSDHEDHHRNFFAAVRARRPVIEDPTFGFRAAGPAVLCNSSYYDRKIYEWDPEKMEVRS